MYMHWLLPLLICSTCKAYQILVISPMPARSHAILSDGLVDLLSAAGHEITYITAFPNEKPASNVKQVNVSSNKNLIPEQFFNFTLFINKEAGFPTMSQHVSILFELSTITLKHPEVQKVLTNPNVQFDVVIGSWMFSDVYTGLAALYQCPFIWLSTVEPHWRILKLIDEVPNPAYNSDNLSGNNPPFTFMQRVQELISQISGLAMEFFWTSDLEEISYEKILVPIIRNRGLPVPPFKKLKYNVSLILGNSHESIGKATRLPQNYKAVGGYHIKKDVKPLPASLQKLLDDAKHGVIYFSMGSNLKSKHLPDTMKRDLLKMFGNLKQTVLWKFEENLLNRPENVHILHWAPQSSILAHPNCILFITHGGLLSITEAIYFGKPIVAIPVFADQFTNTNRAVAKGFAAKVDLSYTMAGDVKNAVEEILGSPRYTLKAKELSLIFHDRPVHPGKDIVHWVEHVVKTRGAPHLRSPAIDVPLYQKLYLDLIFLISIILYGMKLIIKRMYVKITSKTVEELEQKKRK